MVVDFIDFTTDFREPRLPGSVVGYKTSIVARGMSHTADSLKSCPGRWDSCALGGASTNRVCRGIMVN